MGWNGLGRVGILSFFSDAVLYLHLPRLDVLVVVEYISHDVLEMLDGYPYKLDHALMGVPSNSGAGAA